MSWQTVKNTFGSISRSINEVSWASKIMLYFAFVGTAMAINGDGQELIDLMSSEEGMGLLNKFVDMSAHIKESMQGITTEEICAGLNAYTGMCHLFGLQEVHVEGATEVYFDDQVLGHSSNIALFSCNAAQWVRDNLSQEQLDTCNDMLKSSTMG